MDEVAHLAEKHNPKMIIAGFSAYSRNLDWQRFREIADSV
jgi:glycine hydroxymethyltransferase